MRVKATAKGFYGELRKPDVIFDLVDREDADGNTISAASQFSKRWMVEVDVNGNEVGDTVKRAKKSKARTDGSAEKAKAEADAKAKAEADAKAKAEAVDQGDADDQDDDQDDDQGEAEEKAEEKTEAPASRRRRRR